MHIFVATLFSSGDNFFEWPQYFATGPNKLYLFPKNCVSFFSNCTGIRLEWLLVVGKREQAEEGVAGRKGWYGIANKRTSKHRIRGQAVGVGRRKLAEEGVARRKGWYGITNRRASKHRIRGQAVGVGRRELGCE